MNMLRGEISGIKSEVISKKEIVIVVIFLTFMWDVKHN